MAKGTFGISLPCVTLLYSAIFVALSIANFLVTALVLYSQAEDALAERVQALDQSNLRYVRAKLEDSILETKKLNDVHVKNFQTGVISWDVSAPEQGERFRRLLHNSISVHTQYQFITFLYQYRHDAKPGLSWGSAGWFHDNAFFYCNTSGYTGVFDAPAGAVDFGKPLYFFVDGDQGDLSAMPWVEPMVRSANGIAWTPVYTYPHEETGVDLYATYGRRFEHNGKNYSFNLDVNLLYVSKLLRAHKTSERSVAWVVEVATGALVGSSEAKVAEGVTTGGHPSLYRALEDGSFVTVPAWEASDGLIAEASAWLRSHVAGDLRRASDGSFELPANGGPRRLLSVLRFAESGGATDPAQRVDWLLLQVTDLDVYLQGLGEGHRKTLWISGSLTGVIVMLLLVGTACLVRSRRVVYRPLRCERHDATEGADGRQVAVVGAAL